MRSPWQAGQAGACADWCVWQRRREVVPQGGAGRVERIGLGASKTAKTKGPQAPGEAGAIQHASGPTLQQACSRIRCCSSKAAQKEYPNLLRNQVLSLRGETALEHLCLLKH